MLFRICKMAALGNLFVIIFLTYYTNHIIRILFSSKHRTQIQNANIKMEKLRNKPMKTLEEQKEFINTKFPKHGKFKWQWGLVPKIILQVALFILIIRVYFWIFALLNLDLQIWQGILFIIIFPIFFNLLLERFKVQKSDLSIFMKGWFK